MSPRPRAPRGQLDAALKQLDAYIASGHTKPGVLNALTKKIEVFQRLHERELDQKYEGLQVEAAQLRQQVAKYAGFDPDKIQSLTAELNSTKIQNENIRSSNQSYASELATERAKSANLTALLAWVTSRANPERKTAIAIECFIVHGTTGQPLVDALMSAGTYSNWEQLSTSKPKLIDTYREAKNDRDPEAQQTASFCKLMLAKKFETDIDALLAEQAERVRQQDVRESQRHENAVFEREQMVARRRREDAQEEMIRRAEMENEQRGMIEQW
jgi:hypothetical protein